MPRNMGNYERLAPNEQSEQYMKYIGGQKMFGSTMKVSEKLTAEQKAKVRGPGSMPVISDKNSVNATPKQASVGGTVSSVTQRKQQAHTINMQEISSVSQHRPLI